MRDSVATAPVVAALAERGCPLCALRRQAESSFLASFFREMVMDGRCQEALAKEGLCPHHLYLVMDARDKLGAALALRTVVRSRLGRLNALPPRSCFFCVLLERAEAQHVAIIADLFLSSENGRRIVESAPVGFCLPHTEVVTAFPLPHWRGRAESEFRAFCRRSSAQVLKSLDRDLDWFIQKFDYRMAEEPWKGTEDVVERVVKTLAGIPGLPYGRER